MISRYANIVLEAIEGRRVNASGWSRAHCPICEIRLGSSGRTLDLAVNVTIGYFRCWRCLPKGGWLRETGDREWVLAAPPELPAVELPPFFVSVAEMMANPFSQAQYAHAIDYLANVRGLEERTCREAGIGYCADGRYAQRVIIPVTQGTRCVGWLGRDISGRRFRYANNDGMARQFMLFNENALGEDTVRPIILVEGVFDALPYWPDAVAFLGKPSEHQLELLLGGTERPIVVALDGNAWLEGWGVAAKLRMAGIPASFLKVPPGKDPGTVDRAWFRAQVLAAVANGI